MANTCSACCSCNDRRAGAPTGRDGTSAAGPRRCGARRATHAEVRTVSTPVVLFFARGYQADFFPTLRSERFASLFVTLPRGERGRAERLGGRVVGCFEEDYATLPVAAVPADYLCTSLMSDRFL